ncbi:MAG: flagellar biosynthesis protein FlhF [Fibrobacterota bacterium]
MKIKKFKADTMKEALLLVKAELGPGAVILNTKKVSGSLLSAFGREKYEVTAALDEASFARPETTLETAAPAAEKAVATYSPRKLKAVAAARRPAEAAPAPASATAVADAAPPARRRTRTDAPRFDHFAAPALPAQPVITPSAPPANPLEEDNTGFGTLTNDLDKMRNAVYSIAERMQTAAPDDGLPKPLRALREMLEQNEVAPAHALALVSALRCDAGPDNDVALRKQLFSTVSSQMQVSGPLRKSMNGEARRVALVGPTGVGKTTSIAKLASHFKLKEKWKVALIAADNYRIAAIEQIQAFASIADIPLEIVFTDDEMEAALAKFRNFDIVFIDTAGRSQRNADHMSDLRRTLMAAEPHEVHLVLSMTTKPGDITSILRKYGEVGFHRLLFTKLDETLSYGPIFNTVCEAEKPVSYITTGQNVPDDICLADAHALANLVVGGGLA